MKILFLVLGIFLSAQAFSADGSSGCGPGWYVFKENSLVSSALRVITNGVLFPSSTLGMTFGTSNCSQHKIVQKENEAIHFVTMNFYDLKTDIVRGEGEFLSLLPNVLGCEKMDSKVFKAQMKKNYKSSFSSESSVLEAPSVLLQQTYQMILSHPALAQSCLAS